MTRLTPRDSRHLTLYRPALGLATLFLLTACGAPGPDREALQAENSRLEKEVGALRSRLEERAFTAEHSQVVLGNTAVHALTSSTTGRKYVLKVQFPRGYATSEARYPVLYVMDGETNFGGVGYIVQRLIKDRIIPKILVVGVAYGTDYDTFYHQRCRDLTPTFNGDFKPGGAPEPVQSGEAKEFSRLLEEEVFPFIEGKYRVEAGDRALYGHSLGGLYGFYVLLNRPGMFDRYLLLSPSLWWDCKAIFQDLDRNVPYGGEKRLYVATGEFENHQHHCANQSMVDHQLEMVEALQHRESGQLVIESKILEGETHRTIFGRGFTNGLRSIYGDSGGR